MRVFFVVSMFLMGCYQSHGEARDEVVDGGMADADVDTNVQVPDGGFETPVFASSMSLAIDRLGLYWVDRNQRTVMRRDRGRGSPELLFSGSSSFNAPIALHPGGVAWIEHGDRSLQISTVPRTGGPAALVAQVGGGPIGITASGSRVFYSLINVNDGSFNVGSTDFPTGETRLAAEGVYGLDLVVDGNTLYGTTCEAGVWKVDIRTLQDAVFIVDAYCPISLEVAGSALFFFDPPRPSGGRTGLFRAPIEGGVPTRLADTESASFAVHRDHVYFSQGDSIARIGKEGGEVLELAALPTGSSLQGIAVDDDFVYWVELDATRARTFRQTARPR